MHFNDRKASEEAEPGIDDLQDYYDIRGRQTDGIVINGDPDGQNNDAGDTESDNTAADSMLSTQEIIIISSAVGGAILIVCSGIIWWSVRRRRRSPGLKFDEMRQNRVEIL